MIIFGLDSLGTDDGCGVGSFVGLDDGDFVGAVLGRNVG